MACLMKQAAAIQHVWQLSLTVDIASADKVSTLPCRITACSERRSPIDCCEAAEIGAQLLHDEIADVWRH
jgi:hypothetical protein